MGGSLKILVLGGTQFVGRHGVETLVQAGHRVTVFNRGQTLDELPEQVERLRGDRNSGVAGLVALSNRTWDACLDVSAYLPRQVRSSADMLRGRVGHYVFMSAVSVYGDPVDGPVLETQPRLPSAAEDVSDITHATYGPLKVACEEIVQSMYQDRCAILRPQIVAGPYDPWDRFSYWVRRATLGGEMLAPGDGSDHVQVIDARDVAQFTRIVVEQGLAGGFNLAGPRVTWAEFMNILGARNLVWVPNEIIKAEGITEFELPLYRRDGGPRSRLMHVSNARAVAAGLNLTDVAVTARDVHSWLRDHELPPALSADREATLIGICRGTRGRPG